MFEAILFPECIFGQAHTKCDKNLPAIAGAFMHRPYAVEGLDVSIWRQGTFQMIAFPSLSRWLAIVATAGFGLASLPAAVSAAPAKHVILVHGAWGDGSNWSKVVPILAEKGLNVTAVQLPLTSLADDAATVKRAIAAVDGPVVLAGHSYGGAVITEAGNDAKVSALVYVAAFAPDVGQSAGSLNATVAPSPLAAEAKPDAEGFIRLSKTGVYDDFAQDVTPSEKQLLFAAQSPTNVKSLGGNVTNAAWHDKPSWYIVASHDRAIQPALEANMAKTIKAKTTTVEGSHMIMLSKAPAVAAVIEQAAK